MKGFKVGLIVVLSILVLGMTGILVRGITRDGVVWNGIRGFMVADLGRDMKLYEKEELPTEGIRTWKLHLDDPDYDVSICRGDTQKLVVEKWYSHEPGQEERLKTDVQGDTLVLERSKKGEKSRWFWWMNRGHGRVCIYLPQEGLEEPESVWICTIAGDVEISGLRCACSIETVSGEIRLDGIRGRADLQSVSGDIELGEWQGYGDVETVSGDVEIGRLTVEGNIRLEAISGDMEIGVSETSKVEIKTETVSGDEEIHVTQTKGGHSLRAESISGDICIEEVKKN